MRSIAARRTGGIGAAAGLIAALTAASLPASLPAAAPASVPASWPASSSAATATIADFCPSSSPGNVHYYNPPITNSPQWVEVGWYARAKDPVVEESVTFDAIVSRLNGTRAHRMTFDAWSRSNPNDGYEIYGRDTQRSPADTGRWKIHGAGACADIPFSVFSASRIISPVPTGYAVAGSTVTVGSTVRGWNSSGVETPVAGMLVDIDRSPTVAGSPRSHAARVRTDSLGRARAPITVYSNTRIYQNNVLETASRHDPAELQAPIVYVYKRISRTVSDTTPAVGQAVKVAGTVYPARGQVSLQRWNGTTFVTISTSWVPAGGKYTFYYRPATRGSHVLRVYTPYDAWHISTASANAYLTAH